MIEEYATKYHNVYFDILFTSVKLIKFLLEMKIYTCGTANLEEETGSVNQGRMTNV
jgi:hypothetical protein